VLRAYPIVAGVHGLPGALDKIFGWLKLLSDGLLRSKFGDRTGLVLLTVPYPEFYNVAVVLGY
jgi:hypothetical protein